MPAHRVDPDRMFFDLLEGLVREARTERLECAAMMLKSLISALRFHDTGSVPPGFLTVEGWFGLLNHWEGVLKSSQKRQIHYSMSFLKEALKKPELRVPPMSPLLTELVTLMETHSQHQESREAA
ncbi:MAG: hypothetical protein HQL76_15865 [Magnetococcales bacterium]|nr:hypothetical protein [Magnetococcales bacterium]